MAHFIPTNTRANAEDLAQLHLQHVWKLHGVPKVHNTDRGPTFTAEYTRRLFKALNIDQRFSTPYHPQTQGQVENNNKWIETYIRMFCNHQQNNWAELLHTAEFAYNNHHHPSIGMSPFKANVGYDMTLTGEGNTRGQDTPLRLSLIKKLHQRCKDWLERAHRKQEEQYAKRTRETPPLEVGTRVWISSRDLLTDRPSPKLEVLRYGPFPIREVMGPLTYCITLPEGWKTHNVFHRSKLHPVTEDPIARTHNPVTNPNHVTIRPEQDISQGNSNTPTPRIPTTDPTKLQHVTQQRQLQQSPPTLSQQSQRLQNQHHSQTNSTPQQ